MSETDPTQKTQQQGVTQNQPVTEPPKNPPGKEYWQSGTKGSWNSYKKWLGAENFKKFKQTLEQNIVKQMQHDRERSKKAAQNLRKALEGKGDSE